MSEEIKSYIADQLQRYDLAGIKVVHIPEFKSRKQVDNWIIAMLG